jgi:hypothetical protein
MYQFLCRATSEDEPAPAILTGHRYAAQNHAVERRSFFSTLVSEVVPRAVNVQRRAKAKDRLSALERLELSAEQALAVQAMYEEHADRDELARRELRKLTAEQRRLFLELNEPQLRAIREKMSAQRTVLHEVSSDRTLGICRILDENQRRLFVDMRPARLSF